MDLQDSSSSAPDSDPASGGDGRAFLEHAASVFHEINLLEIKRAYRLLCDLEPEIIENFVQKYSDFVIFLLNILDHERSNELLLRLTDSSLIYIAEEELRSVLIREVGEFARNGRDFTDLSFFLDRIDRAEAQDEGEGPELPEFAARVAAQMQALRVANPRRYFAALDNAAAERRLRVLARIVERNVFTAVGILFFAPDRTMHDMLDAIARERPEALARLPAEWFLNRFREDYDLYREARILGHLPESVRGDLEACDAFLEEQREALAELEADASAGDAVERRRRAMDLCYGLLQRADDRIADLLLLELARRARLQPEDAFLLGALRETE